MGTDNRSLEERRAAAKAAMWDKWEKRHQELVKEGRA